MSVLVRIYMNIYYNCLCSHFKFGLISLNGLPWSCPHSSLPNPYPIPIPIQSIPLHNINSHSNLFPLHSCIDVLHCVLFLFMAE